MVTLNDKIQLLQPFTEQAYSFDKYSNDLESLCFENKALLSLSSYFIVHHSKFKEIYRHYV